MQYSSPGYWVFNPHSSIASGLPLLVGFGCACVGVGVGAAGGIAAGLAGGVGLLATGVEFDPDPTGAGLVGRLAAPPAAPDAGREAAGVLLLGTAALGSLAGGGLDAVSPPHAASAQTRETIANLCMVSSTAGYDRAIAHRGQRLTRA
jgi:hypothetical protein